MSRPSSSYSLSQPTQTHPAYFVPVTTNTDAATQPPSRPGSILPPHSPPLQSPQPYASNRVSTLKTPILTTDYKTPLSPTNYPLQPDPYPPPFTPTALAGPNGLSSTSHQPGQIAHPNMTLAAPGEKEPWQHSLCACSARRQHLRPRPRLPLHPDLAHLAPARAQVGLPR